MVSYRRIAEMSLARVSGYLAHDRRCPSISLVGREVSLRSPYWDIDPIVKNSDHGWEDICSELEYLAKASPVLVARFLVGLIHDETRLEATDAYTDHGHDALVAASKLRVPARLDFVWGLVVNVEKSDEPLANLLFASVLEIHRPLRVVREMEQDVVFLRFLEAGYQKYPDTFFNMLNSASQKSPNKMAAFFDGLAQHEGPRLIALLDDEMTRHPQKFTDYFIHLPASFLPRIINRLIEYFPFVSLVLLTRVQQFTPPLYQRWIDYPRSQRINTILKSFSIR